MGMLNSLILGSLPVFLMRGRLRYSVGPHPTWHLRLWPRRSMLDHQLISGHWVCWCMLSSVDVFHIVEPRIRSSTPESVAVHATWLIIWVKGSSVSSQNYFSMKQMEDQLHMNFNLIHGSTQVFNQIESDLSLPNLHRRKVNPQPRQTSQPSQISPSKALNGSRIYKSWTPPLKCINIKSHPDHHPRTCNNKRWPNQIRSWQRMAGIVRLNLVPHQTPQKHLITCLIWRSLEMDHLCPRRERWSVLIRDLRRLWTHPQHTKEREACSTELHRRGLRAR